MGDGILNLTPSLKHPTIASLALGVGVHAICHYHPPTSLTAFASVILVPPTLILASYYHHLSISQFSIAPLIYLCSLALSIIIYRLSPFHPLAKYPGPRLARISRLWAAWGVVRGRQCLESHELFRCYGDVVRTGPNHLIIRDASVIPALHGTKDRWIRHGRYQVHLPYNARESLLELTDIGEHAKRRRMWDRAFTSGAIKTYEPMLQARLAQLVHSLAARTGQSVDLSEWIGFFTLDFMGDFAFGGMFEFLKHGADYDGVHRLLMTFTEVVEFFGTIPWTRPLLGLLSSSQAMNLERICVQVATKRMAEGSPTRDLFHYLLSEDSDDDIISLKLSPKDLSTEAMLAIGAGSDTTATAILNAIYYLIIHPAVLIRLREELDHVSEYPSAYEHPIEPGKLGELRYLQAIINETLRLKPAVPNGVQRVTPIDKGDIALGQYVIPAETTVQVSTWSLHRDPRYFSPYPNDFWPERWLPEEGPKLAEVQGQDFRLLQGAYIPFHYGPGNCAGRALALHEARTVLAALVRRFDFTFATGYKAQDWIDQLKDRFLLIRGELKVVVSARA